MLSSAGASEDLGSLKELATKAGADRFVLEQSINRLGNEIETLKKETLEVEKEKVKRHVSHV